MAGYAGGVIGSGVNSKDYHKSPDLAADSLDMAESPLEGFANDSLLSITKNVKNEFRMDDILIEMN